MATAAADADAGQSAGLDRLCARLRDGLGAFGYQWLCACAVYPRLRFSLSGYLGAALAEALERRPVAEAEMLALYRLPWFRDGYMPPALRLRLIADLEPRARTAARAAIERALYAATADGEGELGREPLPVPAPPRRWRAMLRAYLSAAPADAVEHDTIFARAMARRSTSPAAVARERARVRLLGPALARLVTRRTPALLAIVALLVAGWATAGRWLKPSFEERIVVRSIVAVPARTAAPAPPAAPAAQRPAAADGARAGGSQAVPPSVNSGAARRSPTSSGRLATASKQPDEPCGRGHVRVGGICQCPPGKYEGEAGTRAYGFCIDVPPITQPYTPPAATQSGSDAETFPPTSQQAAPSAQPPAASPGAANPAATGRTSTSSSRLPFAGKSTGQPCARGHVRIGGVCQCPSGKVEGGAGTRAAGYCIDPPTEPEGAPAAAPTTAGAQTNAPASPQPSLSSTAPNGQAALGDTSASEARMRAQQALVRLGFSPGAVDGLAGPRYTAALRRFQAQNGIPATGDLDNATVKALGLANEAN